MGVGRFPLWLIAHLPVWDLRAVSVGGESANFLPAQEGMYINIIKCLISEAAVFCCKDCKVPDSCLS